MSQLKDFTSLPPAEEQTFVVYEKHSIDTLAKAKKIGMIVAGIFGLLVVGIAFSFEKPKNKMADDDMGMLQKAESKEADVKKEAPKPDPPAAAPEATDEDKEPEPAADGEKPAEGGDSKDSE